MHQETGRPLEGEKRTGVHRDNVGPVTMAVTMRTRFPSGFAAHRDIVTQNYAPPICCACHTPYVERDEADGMKYGSSASMHYRRMSVE